MISSTLSAGSRRTKQGPVPMLRTSLLAVACLALSACGAPKQDTFKSQGGIAPDPSGIIAGSILYVGPRPSCEYKSGKATRVIGRVVLTLFAYDNPPPPEGRATTALNLAFHNPERLFSLSDCLPNGKKADPSERITRSMDFSWPQIALGAANPVSYQIRGFYDSDEDMNPFFSVRNLPTAGDIIGGAVVDPQDPKPKLLEIVMPPAAEAEDGYRRQGVIVALGNYVWLERPAFKLSAANRFLDGTKDIVVKQTQSGAIDVRNTLVDAWGQTCGRIAKDCGLTLEQLTPEDADSAFEKGGVKLDFEPEHYAFVSEPVDIVTVKLGEADEAKPDGVPDPHPLMGSNLGVNYYTPITIMTRTAPTQAMADIEALAGIPNVRLIGSPLLDATGKPEKRVRTGSIPIAVPNVAAVELDPNDTSCRLPYLAPGNLTRAFESRLTYCHDLPTGLYGVSAIQGVAGGVREEASETVSDNGYVYNGSRLSGQAWSLPNDLGLTTQIGDDIDPSQGRGQLFVVYDPDPDNQGDCSQARDPDNSLAVRPVNYHGICEVTGEDPVVENPEGETGAGIDGQGCLPQKCCAAIQHLCGIELCELCDDESCPGLDLGEKHPIRQGPTSVTVDAKGHNIPNCLPFELPDLCCG